MTALELLEAIGDVNGAYILEAQSVREPRPRRRTSKWKILILAAAMALLLSGCAYAVLKLQDLQLGQWTPNPVFMDETERDKPHPSRDVISLHGFAGSPGFQALQEWLEFKNTYDTDESGQNNYSSPEAYRSFFCFNQEMQDKVDELCQKYGLNLPGRSIISYDAEGDLFPSVGISSILREDAAVIYTFEGAGTYFQSGNFHLPGKLTLTDSAWTSPFVYFFSYTSKDCFDGNFMSVGSIDSFQQWTYTASDGTPLLLAVSPESCLVLADRGNAVISITVCYPICGETVLGDEPMTHAALEAFADCFDYSIKPLGIGRTYPGYAEFLTGLCPAPTENDLYLLRDLDGDGSDELLVTHNGSFSLVLTMENDRAKIVYFAPDLWLSGDVILDNTYVQEGQEIYRMLAFREGRFEYENYIENSVLKEGWGKSAALGDKPYWEVPITADEAWGIINSYELRQPRWFPVADFPGFAGAPIAVTEEPTFPEALTPEELGRAAETDLEFYLEGQPTATAAQLFIGQGYSLYVNHTDWFLEQSENTDLWTSEYNPDVQLAVTFYPGLDAEDTHRAIRDRESDYQLGADKRGGLNGLSQDRVMQLSIAIYETDSGTFAVSCRYPMAAAEGFGTRLSVMADTFELWPES
ncbi:MAG: hypothetical protein Q4F17_10500 [Eubacteriales bacterium]|nr:hypothetical protein [Eubacteriales bacterium]